MAINAPRISFHGKRNTMKGTKIRAYVNAIRGCATKQIAPAIAVIASHFTICSRAEISSNKRNVAAIRNGSSEVAKPNAISGPAFSSPYGWHTELTASTGTNSPSRFCRTKVTSRVALYCRFTADDACWFETFDDSDTDDDSDVGDACEIREIRLEIRLPRFQRCRKYLHNTNIPEGKITPEAMIHVILNAA